MKVQSLSLILFFAFNVMGIYGGKHKRRGGHGRGERAVPLSKQAMRLATLQRQGRREPNDTASDPRNFRRMAPELGTQIMEVLSAKDKASMRRVNEGWNDIYRQMMQTDNVSKMKLLMNQMVFQSVDELESTLNQIRALHSESQFSEQYALEMPMYLKQWRKDMQSMDVFWRQHPFAASVAEELRRDLIVERVKGLIDLIQPHGECSELDPFTKLLVTESHAIWERLVSERVPNLLDLRLYGVLWDHLESRNGPQLPSLHAMYRIADDSKGRYLRHLVVDCGLILIHPHYLDPESLKRNWIKAFWENQRFCEIRRRMDPLSEDEAEIRDGMFGEAISLIHSDLAEHGVSWYPDDGLGYPGETFPNLSHQVFVNGIGRLCRWKDDYELRRYITAWKLYNKKGVFDNLLQWPWNSVQGISIRKMMEDLNQEELTRLLVAVLTVAVDDPAVTRRDIKHWTAQLSKGQVFVHAEGVMAVWNGPIPQSFAGEVIPWLRSESTLTSSSDGSAAAEYGSI